MNYLNKYKISENLNSDKRKDAKNNLVLSKKIFKIIESKVISLFKDNGDLFYVKTLYPGLIDSENESYLFKFDKKMYDTSSEELTDDEIVDYFIDDNINIYEMVLTFGIQLTLYDLPDMEKMYPNQSKKDVVKSILKKLSPKYDILDLEEEGSGDIWFVVQYNLSEYFDKIGKVFNDINK